MRIVNDLAARCKRHDNLIGFELLNEPRWDVPLEIIKRFYQEAYHRVREHIAPDRAAVVIHDAFRPRDWADFMQEPEYAGVILDTHPYQCFTDDDRKRDLHGHIEVRAAWSGRSCWTTCSGSFPAWSVNGRAPCRRNRSRAGRDWHSMWRCAAYGDAQLINFDSHAGLVFLDVQDRRGRCAGASAIASARLAAGEIRPRSRSSEVVGKLGETLV